MKNKQPHRPQAGQPPKKKTLSDIRAYLHENLGAPLRKGKRSRPQPSLPKLKCLEEKDDG